MEPLKWTRRKEEKDYVAHVGGTTYCIFGERGVWSLATLDPPSFNYPTMIRHEGMTLPDFYSLADAKLAVEVILVGMADVVAAHHTDARSRLIGGGHSGFGRVYGSHWWCSCGQKSNANVGNIREAREDAAHHVRSALENALKPQKVT